MMTIADLSVFGIFEKLEGCEEVISPTVYKL